MTADEIVFAGGGFSDQNPSSYYYANANGNSSTGSWRWWLASPSHWLDSSLRVLYVAGSDYPGSLMDNYSDVSYLVRPVISLKSCVKVTNGDGSSDSPYEVSIDENCKLAIN